ncbi:MAG: PEP-CTERM sorting domain-containing protein [Polyangiaceae bacterium]
MSTGRGRNVVRNGLAPLTEIVDVDASMGIAIAIEDFFRRWDGAPKYRAVRERVPSASARFTEEAKTSEHLARLWASEEVDALTSSGKRAEAVALATKRKLVTRVTGAAVLETDKDYTDNGLTPPGPDRVPSVPEPGTWVAVAITMLGLVFWLLIRRRSERDRLASEGAFS